MDRSVPLTTDRQILSLRPTRTIYEKKITGSRGLSIRVLPSSTKQFEFRYTNRQGARRRLALGTYPDLSLAEARLKAAGVRVAVADGHDPVAERQAARAKASKIETLDALAEDYWVAAEVGLHGGRRKPKRAVTISNERSVWRNHIQPVFGSRDFSGIRRAEIKAFMRTLVVDKKLSPASLASIGGVLHAVLGFAVMEERLEANPAAGLARPLALTSRERMFDDARLKVLWTAAGEASLPRTPGEKTAGIHARLEPAMGLAIQLLMLTLTRRNEVAGALKTEFDLEAGLWTIPAARAKAAHRHVVPLSPESLEVLEAAFALDPASPYVFPSDRVEGQHLDPHAITRAFARTCARRKIESGSPHDVRRSGATTLTGRYGVTRFIVGLVLGHTPNEGAAVTGVYDRHTYIPEKRAALETWARHLTGAPAVAGSKSPAPIDGDLAQTKARARMSAEQGELQNAVLVMCMGAARASEEGSVHLDILARAGMDLASKGEKEHVLGWIDGF